MAGTITTFDGSTSSIGVARLLPDGTPDPDVAAALAQARQQLAGAHRTGGYTPPALDAMVSDFAWYHVALAVVAAVVVVALLGLSVMCWRRFARVGATDRRTRRVWGWFGAFATVSTLIMAVLLVANAGTATDPAPALLALFNGGF